VAAVILGLIILRSLVGLALNFRAVLPAPAALLAVAIVVAGCLVVLGDQASRLRMTRDVVRLISRLQRRPAVMVSGSSIGWYGTWGDESLTEFDGGKRGFGHRVCAAWECAASEAEKSGVRVVRLRIGLVLGTEAGMLSNLLAPFEFGLGGPIGSGQQWMSWIARDDLIRLIAHIIANPQLSGAVNGTAPVPVRNATFAQELGRALHRPAVLRMPASLLHRLAGDLADELLLGGRRVLPDKAEASGFKFRHETLPSALSAIPGMEACPLRPRTRSKNGALIFSAVAQT